MKKVYKLYIDELGMSHPGSFETSPYYILLGCIIDEQHQRELEDYANHIKFKYWGRTDIIFHSADIAHNTRGFEILADETIKQQFYKDLMAMLHAVPFNITAAIVDKRKAYESFWKEKTVIKRSAEAVLFNFLAYVYGKMPSRGKIIIDASNIDRDTQYLEAFNRLLSPSFQPDEDTFVNVRETLTSINFVTKQNHDIEAQVADLMAFGIRCKQEVAANNAEYAKSSYEYKIMHVAETKLIKTDPSMSKDKKKYFSMIHPAEVMPAAVSKPQPVSGTSPAPKQKEKRG